VTASVENLHPRKLFQRNPLSHDLRCISSAVFAYQLSGVRPDMMLVISRGIGQGPAANNRKLMSSALAAITSHLGLLGVPPHNGLSHLQRRKPFGRTLSGRR
jgi:hypothetical protein